MLKYLKNLGEEKIEENYSENFKISDLALIVRCDSNITSSIKRGGWPAYDDTNVKRT